MASTTTPGPALLTVGHGTLDERALGDLLTGAGVELLVDVRRFPGSRSNPAVARGALPRWLPGRGIDYRWEERLGGRRRLDGPVHDPWWRVASFAAYAAWTRGPEFGAALEKLLAGAAEQRTAVMCSEAVWWRCHRRLIADVAVLLHAAEVRHLMHDGRQSPHQPAAGARRTPAGVVWDGGGTER